MQSEKGDIVDGLSNIVVNINHQSDSSATEQSENDGILSEIKDIVVKIHDNMGVATTDVAIVPSVDRDDTSSIARDISEIKTAVKNIDTKVVKGSKSTGSHQKKSEEKKGTPHVCP